MLADIVLGQHLLLTALLRPRLALGILLLTKGSRFLHFRGGSLLLLVPLPGALQTYFRSSNRIRDFVFLPPLQTLFHAEITLFLDRIF